MEQLLTPDDVAKLLQVSLKTVYVNGKRLGGFYPGGIKVLRFREEVIREFMEGQGKRDMEVHLSGEREGLRRGGTQDQGGSEDGQGREEEIRRSRRTCGISEIISTDDRHGLRALMRSLSGRKSAPTC